jgi:hypothetical protein
MCFRFILNIASAGLYNVLACKGSHLHIFLVCHYSYHFHRYMNRNKIKVSIQFNDFDNFS